MSKLLYLLLAQLFLALASALAIPPTSTPTNPIWDLQRATIFTALLDAALTNDKNEHTNTIKPIAYDVNITTPRSEKPKTNKTVTGAKHVGATTTVSASAPIRGIQCIVM